MRYASRNPLLVVFSLLSIPIICLSFLLSSRLSAHAVSSQLNTTNWPMYGFNSRHTGLNPNETTITPSNVSQLVLDWSVPTDYFATASQPAVANGVIYYGSHDKVYAFNAATGATLWIDTFQGSNTDSVSPIVANGIVYVCPSFSQASLYALYAKTGKILWSTTIAGANVTYAAPTLASGVLYEGWSNDKFYAISTKTGKILWSVHMYTLYASPSVFNGVVYVSADVHMYALDAQTGKRLWSVNIGGYSNTPPAIVNGVAYVAGGSPDGYYQAQLAAFNAKTGATIWVDGMNNGVPWISSPSSLAVANGILYMYSGEVYAFSTKTGKLLWHTNTGSSATEPSSSPIVANGVVYVGAFDSKLYAFDAETGKTLWSYTTGSYIDGLPVVVNGVVYAGSSDFKLYAFHLPGTSD